MIELHAMKALSVANPYDLPTTEREAKKRHREQNHRASVVGARSWQTCETFACRFARQSIANPPLQTCPTCGAAVLPKETPDD